MILARIDPQSKQVTMVSLHRDTLIDMGTNGKQKLNAAHSIGGAAYTDRGRFEVLARAFPSRVMRKSTSTASRKRSTRCTAVWKSTSRDGNQTTRMRAVASTPGLQTLNGDQALILCRARHAYDAYGDGDRYRAANQRLVLSAVAKKIRLLRPDYHGEHEFQALSKYITTDFNVTDIVSLASRA